MPKVRTKRTKVPPGFDTIEETLTALEQKMRDAETSSDDKKRKTEVCWDIFRLHHQRSRYIYEMFYKKKEISREVYNFCLREGYADANLIAKWKKQGYERLCCLQCIQPKDHNFGTTCICRVPKKKVSAHADADRIECSHCGCKGCAVGD